MKYIIDSSDGFKWEVPEADSEKALRLRQHHELAIHELLAPDDRRVTPIFLFFTWPPPRPAAIN